jgi:tRNA/rRNA methyltransferase
VTGDLRVVLLRPKEDGNVGAVARAMKNFSVEDLVLVNPRAPLGAEARRRAMGGLSVLQRARVQASLEDALEGTDLVVGSTDLSGGRARSYLRRSITPEQLGMLLGEVRGRVALLFGPEDNGLDRSELSRCDLLLHIPSDRGFPTLNLSHAVAIVLYELYRARSVGAPSLSPPRELNGTEKELFFALLAKFLSRRRYPEHKRRGLLLLFRRMLGRAAASREEYSMLLGFLRRAEGRVRR